MKRLIIIGSMLLLVGCAQTSPQLPHISQHDVKHVHIIRKAGFKVVKKSKSSQAHQEARKQALPHSKEAKIAKKAGKKVVAEEVAQKKVVKKAGKTIVKEAAPKEAVKVAKSQLSSDEIEQAIKIKKNNR